MRGPPRGWGRPPFDHNFGPGMGGPPGMVGYLVLMSFILRA